MSGNGKPGPPRLEFDEAMLQTIEDYAGELTLEQLSDLLGISRALLQRRISDTVEVRRRYYKGRAERIKKIAMRLVAKAEAGDITAMIFYLKTQAGWKETQRIEGDFTHEHSHRIEEAAEQFEGRIARIAARN